MPMRIRANKLHHMGMVAEYMRVRAEDYGLDPGQAYVVGLLHDFGYIYGRKNHGLQGALVLRSMNLNADCVQAIEFHGVSPYRIDNPKMPASILLNNPQHKYEEIPEEIRKNRMLTLLLEADMRVDKTGEIVGFIKRAQDLFCRYKNPDVRSNVEETIHYVFEWCEKNGVANPPKVQEVKDLIWKE